MQQAWQAFLEQHGLSIVDDGGAARAVAGSATPVDAAACVDLNHYAAMRLVGPDAATFLQGYLTCDTKLLTSSQALLGAYCNIKGRVVADATVMLVEGHPALIVHASVREKIAESLKKFLAFSRSRFASAGDAPILLGLLNPPFDSVLPEQPLSVAPYRAGWAVALPGPIRRVLLALPIDAAMETWREYDSRRQTGDAAGWELIDVRGGIVRVRAATSEEFLPQMLDYDRLGAVSFTKGCYLGQEIVARTQHLGRAKRHLHALTWQGAAMPRIGATLLTSTAGRAGTLVGIARTGADRGEALAVLNDAIEGPLDVGGVTFALR